MATIVEQFEETHRGSARLAERGRELFPSGVTHDGRALDPFPIYVDRAVGPRKWDVDGNEYVDYFGGHGALLLGHNRPEVMEAVHAALNRGTHFGASHDLELAWGEQVVRMVPCAERVRFTSSGTEATMMALRLARAFTGRERVVKLAEHFHGWHDLVVARQGEDGAELHSPGVPAEVYESLTIVPQNDGEALRAALEPGDVAAVILETSGAHWGALPIDREYLRTARELTAEAGALLVFDEVITGFRLAPGGGQEFYGVTPDLSCHAKIVAGGLPGGCVSGRADVMAMMEIRPGDRAWNAKQRVLHPGTFNANPLSAAAGATALRLIAEGGEVERAAETCGSIIRGLNAMFRGLGVPGSAYGQVSMWHVNLGYEAHVPADVEWDGAEPPRGVDPKLQHPLRLALLNRGVDCMGIGGMVSSTHGPDEIFHTVEAFHGAVGDLRAEGLLG